MNIIESYLKEQVELGPFNETLYKKNVSDEEKKLMPSIENWHKRKSYTIYFDKKPCGFLSNVPVEKFKGALTQVVIFKEFRGKGILKLAYEELVKKHNFKKLMATINKNNIASLKAHIKIGFKEFPEDWINNLIKQGKLKSDQTRLYKNY